MKFVKNYYLSPGRHYPIARPYRGLLLPRIHELEVDVVVLPWDDE